MRFLNDFFKSSFEKWIENASDKELEDAYEDRRQRNLIIGNGEKTPEMNKLNNEMSKRSEEKWEKDPRRNTDPNFRWTDENRWDKD